MVECKTLNPQFTESIDTRPHYDLFLEPKHNHEWKDQFLHDPNSLRKKLQLFQELFSYKCYLSQLLKASFYFFRKEPVLIGWIKDSLLQCNSTQNQVTSVLWL